MDVTVLLRVTFSAPAVSTVIPVPGLTIPAAEAVARVEALVIAASEELCAASAASFATFTAAGVAATPPETPEVLSVASLSFKWPYCDALPTPYVVFVLAWEVGGTPRFALAASEVVAPVPPLFTGKV